MAHTAHDEPTTLFTSMASRLRAARKRLKLTQQQVADHLSVDRTAVLKWESQSPSQSTKPERDRLFELAKLYRVEVDWLLSDGGSEALPPLLPDIVPLREAREAPPAETWGHLSRTWWDAVEGKLRTRRTDTWSKAVKQPSVPAWQKPLVPDFTTARSCVTVLSLPRPYYYVFVQQLAQLHAFATVRKHAGRRAALFWLPAKKDVPKHLQDEVPQFDDLQDRIHELASALGIEYYVVTSKEEAVEYLAQIL